MTPEELAQRFAEQLAKTPVSDILLQSLATLIDSAGVRLGLGPTGQNGADLAQARQAIEGADALLGVVEREVGAAEAEPFREAVRVVKMAFVDLSGRAAEGGPTAPPDGDAAAAEPAGAPPEGDAPDAGADRAGRLWVPPGTRDGD